VLIAFGVFMQIRENNLRHEAELENSYQACKTAITAIIDYKNNQ
jgi:hypothetical protein